MVMIIWVGSNELHSLIKSIIKEVLVAANFRHVTFLGPVCMCVNQEDVFSISAVDLGVLKKLRIRHDNSQASAGWFLDRVEIIDNSEDTT